MPAFTLDDVDNTDRFHLVYSGDHEVCLHDSPLDLSVNLIRSCGTPAPIGCYLVNILPSSGIVSQLEYFVSNGEQELPFIGCDLLQHGDILGVSPSPLIEIPFDDAWSWPESNSGDQIDVDSNLQGLVGAVDESEAKEPKASPPALLERFNNDQRKAFLEM